MLRHRLARASSAAAVLGLTACAIPFGATPGPRPSDSAVAACNTRADEIYLRQNRDALYKSDTYQSSIRDSPYAGAGLPDTSQGLAGQYERGQDLRSCLNGATTPLRAQPSATAAP